MGQPYLDPLFKPLGLLGSIGNFGDLEGFEFSANRAQQVGCEGAACIHPNQVTVLNRVFSPSAEKVAYARRVVEAFESGVDNGTASVNVDGNMVDIPIYYRVKRFWRKPKPLKHWNREKLRRWQNCKLIPLSTGLTAQCSSDPAKKRRNVHRSR